MSGSATIEQERRKDHLQAASMSALGCNSLLKTFGMDSMENDRFDAKL
jgi:hypothetical protein